MTLFKQPVLPLLLTICMSNLPLVVQGHSDMHHLVRRESVEDCTQHMVQTLWQDHPKFAQAVACFKDKLHYNTDSEYSEDMHFIDWYPCYFKGWGKTRHYS
ncbi:uncharacterized protein UTRI_10199 [Ustilago trichophora]|uniref:Secreted protein n=1 Tax=Ustilago trichophora TaxID=86804 RepID=A0A5C3ECU1_9BASI|nr:uncharacterized protein UTRI_10199 [Ustilago trichophora]